MAWPPEDGTPYMPSNGTEGDIFESGWCEHCARDSAFRNDPNNHDGCPILSFAHGVGQPKEWTWRKGEPHCSLYTEDPSCPVRCTDTLEMFR